MAKKEDDSIAASLSKAMDEAEDTSTEDETSTDDEVIEDEVQTDESGEDDENNKDDSDESDADENSESEDDKDGAESGAEGEGDDADGTEASGEVDDEAGEEEGADDGIEAPHSWNGQDSQVFAELPTAAKEVISRRENERDAAINQKMQEVSQIKQTQDQIEQVIAPHRQQFQLHGLDDVGAIRQLVAAHEFLQKDPVQALQYMAQSYGVDLTKISEMPKTDPELLKVRQELDGLRTHLKTQSETAEQENTQALTAQIDAFANEVDDSQQLKHPHFAEVRLHMGSLMQTGAAADMQSAYDMATWANPQIRQKLTTADKSSEAKKAASARKIKADKAKKASFKVKGKTGSKSTDAPSTLRGALEKNFEASA